MVRQLHPLKAKDFMNHKSGFHESQIKLFFYLIPPLCIQIQWTISCMKKSESSVERCAGIAPQLLQKRPEALCSRPYKQISKIIKQKNHTWG